MADGAACSGFRRDEQVLAHAQRTLSYATACAAAGDAEGFGMAVKHAVELLLDLLGDHVLDAVGAIAAGGAAPAMEPPDLEPAPAPETPVKRKRGNPAERADAKVTRLPRNSAPWPPEHEPEVRGSSARRTDGPKKFRLFEAYGDTWKPVATGTASELASEYGVTANQVYALSRKKGSTSGDGRWRCEAVG